jgi:hypothetical protein
VMKAREHRLKNGTVLVIREVAVDDARALLDYADAVSSESKFLTFGPGEFDFTEPKEQRRDSSRKAPSIRKYFSMASTSIITGCVSNCDCGKTMDRSLKGSDHAN